MSKKVLLFLSFCLLCVFLKAQTITITLRGDSVLKISVYSSYIEPGCEAKDSVGNDYTQYVIVDTGGLYTGILADFQIRYYVPDSIGLAEVKTRTVQVRDTTKPVIVLIGGDTLCFHLGEEYVDPGIEATDNYDANPRIIVQTNLPQNGQSKLYLKDSMCYDMIYAATDISGNHSEKTRTICVCYGRIVGVKTLDSELAEIKIYPNPAHDKITIEGVSSHATITISNVLGKVVFSESNTTTIDVSSLSRGIYFISITGDRGLYATKKVLIH